jgi:hypothetical protein
LREWGRRRTCIAIGRKATRKEIARKTMTKVAG